MIATITLEDGTDVILQGRPDEIEDFLKLREKKIDPYVSPYNPSTTPNIWHGIYPPYHDYLKDTGVEYLYNQPTCISTTESIFTW